VIPEPLYDVEAIDRAVAELDARGRLGDAVRNLAKLLDKATAELEAVKRLSFKNGFEAVRLAPYEHTARGWQGRAVELEAQVDAIRTLHRRVSDEGGHLCDSCLNGWGEAVRWPCATIRALDAASDTSPPVAAASPEARGVVWRGWALGLQDWAEESQISDLDPTDKSGFGWNAALKAVCIAIVQATLGDFPYLVDPDCECEGQCPMCARWDCEQCCDGGMPADHGVKEGIVVRTPEKP
jgi:hypothetical protein